MEPSMSMGADERFLCLPAAVQRAAVPCFAGHSAGMDVIFECLCMEAPGQEE